MKNVIMTLILTVVLTVSNINVIASDSINVNQFLLKEIQLQLIHPKTTAQQWRALDEAYLTSVDKSIIQTEIETLRTALDKLKCEFISTKNGTRIYGYDTVEWIDTLTSAIVTRQYILDGKQTSYKNIAYVGNSKLSVPNKQIKPTDTNKRNQVKAVLTLLSSDKLPKDLVTNLDIYLTPYVLETKIAHARSKLLNGRDEEIMMAFVPGEISYNSQLGVFAHELGHVMYFDTVGTTDSVKSNTITSDLNEYKRIVSLINKETSISDIREIYADSFSQALTGVKNNLNNQDLAKYILTKLSNYSVMTNRVVDTIVINETIPLRGADYTNSLNSYSAPVNIDYKGNDELKINILNSNGELLLSNQKFIANSPITLNIDAGDYTLQIHNSQVILEEINIQVKARD